MATKQTIITCLKQLEIAYGKAEDSEARALLYIDILADIPDETLTKATRDHIAVSKWYPKPAELREIATKIRANRNASTQFDDPENDAERKRLLYWQAMGDYNTFDPETMRLSKALAWYYKTAPAQANV